MGGRISSDGRIVKTGSRWEPVARRRVAVPARGIMAWRARPCGRSRAYGGFGSSGHPGVKAAYSARGAVGAREGDGGVQAPGRRVHSEAACGA